MPYFLFLFLTFTTYRKNVDKLPESDKAVALAILTPLMERLKAQQEAECGEGEEEEMKEVLHALCTSCNRL